MTLGIAIDAPDWHHGQLGVRVPTARAFRLQDCRFDTGSTSGVTIPGFDDALPSAVLVRAIGGGSFEEVTRRLGVLHALRELGVPVWNDARAIERCVDKSMTGFLLARAGLTVPRTWTIEGIEAAQALVAARAGAPLVLKPLFGAQGRGLRIVRSSDDLPEPAPLGGVYLLQEFIEGAGPGFADLRLLLARGRILAAMRRRNETWITNIRQGARPEPIEPDAALRDVALRACACVGADYAGVDIIEDRAGGLVVLEVNSMPGWRGLQQVTQAPIASLLLDALLC